jgi:hypothetical protein
MTAVGAAPASAQFPEQPVLTPPPTPAPAPKPAARPAPPPRRAARPGEVETVPIKCWWKTDTTEVRVGQRFTLTLTCGVIETPRLKVTANTNALDPGALQVTPFEVASGVRRDDILSPPWRYFQYDYEVRLLSEGFFGQDVTLPSVPVTYNIQAAAGDGAQGRDLTYVLPALPMRVASLVPRGAADIRDVSGTGFAAIAERRFRASMATVIGSILVGFALVLAVFAFARAIGRVRSRTPAAGRPLAPFTVLGATLATLKGVKASVAREGGWSPALVRQALGATRVAAAIAAGRPVAQTGSSGAGAAREGQVVVRHGVLRRRTFVVSAATTSSAIDRALAEGGKDIRRRQASLEALRTALQAFSAGAYGRSQPDTLALDRALSDSADAVKALRLRSLVPVVGGPAPPPPVTSLAASMSGDRA